VRGRPGAGAGARTPGPEGRAARRHRGPGRGQDQRSRGEPRDRFDRTLGTGPPPPCAHPPARPDRRRGLVDDGRPTGVPARPGAGRGRRRAITVLAQRLWPTTPIQRCWWHLPHGLRKALYVDDAHNRHNNPHWACDRKNELAELLREQIRAEHTVEQALADWDAFTAKIPAALTAAHAFLDAARPHAFTCLDPALRKALACIGGPELATGVLERLMREINARTDIGGVRWTISGLRDMLTVLTARILRHPVWTEIRKNVQPSNTIQFRLQKFNAT
jgi:hypothetical protein